MKQFHFEKVSDSPSVIKHEEIDSTVSIITPNMWYNLKVQFSPTFDDSKNFIYLIVQVNNKESLGEEDIEQVPLS